MAEKIRPHFTAGKLTKAGHFLAEQILRRGLPVLAPFELARLILAMYDGPNRKSLYLRGEKPKLRDYTRIRVNLLSASILQPDPDYRQGMLRVPGIADLSAEEIACLADPLCYVSHLSAMQRWGLTNRQPDALILTRPSRGQAKARLDAMMRETSDFATLPVPLRNIAHPDRVRGRSIRLHEAKTVGARMSVRATQLRLATVGQTFLDMLQSPELCGSMPHVLEIWDEHARGFLSEIVDSVDGAESPLVKSRAGYILEERLGFKDRRIEAWKALGQRGGSRKLDPGKSFAPAYSETWMISLNV